MLAFHLFKHYLLSRRAGAVVRTVAWLSISGVAVGVMALVVVLSVMNGFNDSIREKLLAVEPHVVASVPGAKTFEDVVASPAFRALKARANLRVSAFETQDVLLRTSEGLYGGAIARGVEPEALAYMLAESRRANMARARPGDARGDFDAPPVADESSRLGPDEAIVGVDLARGLGMFEGDRVIAVAPEALLLPPGEAPAFERLTVKSLLVSNVADVDAKFLYYVRGKALARLRDAASREVGFEVRMPNADDSARLAAEIERLGAKAETWQQRNSTLFYALRLEKFAIGAVLAAAALIASLSIVTVLVLLLMQKRKDIGSLMAMGLSRQRTLAAFVGLGLILGFCGLGGGLAAGLAICYVIQRYPLPILPDYYYDTTIPVRVDPWLIAAVLICATLVAGLSAWLPARAHARLEPADALRARGLGA